MAASKKKKKKTAAKKPPEKRIEPFTRECRVVLKADEIADRADRAAQLLADRDGKEEEQKAQAKHAKSVIDQLEAELRRLSNEVRTKATYKEVDCERRYLFKEGRVMEVRLDTEEVLSDRPMTDIEKQQNLPFEEPGPGDEKKPDGGAGGDLENEFGGTGTEGE